MDIRQFLVAVLVGLRAPDNGDNLLALVGWHACEGGSAAFNPLNTTLWQPGATAYNSFGPHGAYHVRNYPDLTTGVRATVLTIENGHYPHVLDALRAGHLASAIEQGGPVLHELDVWGTGGAHVQAWLRANAHGQQPPPTPPPHPHTVYVVRPGDTLSEIAARYHVHGGWQHLYGVNRHVIGSDPDTIRPGERLVIS